MSRTYYAAFSSTILAYAINFFLSSPFARSLPLAGKKALREFVILSNLCTHSLQDLFCNWSFNVCVCVCVSIHYSPDAFAPKSDTRDLKVNTGTSTAHATLKSALGKRKGHFRYNRLSIWCSFNWIAIKGSAKEGKIVRNNTLSSGHSWHPVHTFHLVYLGHFCTSGFGNCNWPFKRVK